MSLFDHAPGWFDGFMEMKMVDGTLNEEEECSETEEALTALNDELAVLQNELSTVEGHEPDDILSDAYSRWEARRDLLEEQIFDIEDSIQELENE